MTQIKLSGEYRHISLAEFLRDPNAEASGHASCTALRTVSLSIGWRDFHVVRRSRSTSRVLRSSMAAPISGMGRGGSTVHRRQGLDASQQRARPRRSSRYDDRSENKRIEAATNMAETIDS